MKSIMISVKHGDQVALFGSSGLPGNSLAYVVSRIGGIHVRQDVGILLQEVGFSLVDQPFLFNQMSGKPPCFVGK